MFSYILKNYVKLAVTETENYRQWQLEIGDIRGWGGGMVEAENDLRNIKV